MSVEEILYAILIGCAIGLSNSQDATVGCTGEADIVFLVHSSNSLGNSGFRQELNFVQQLIVGFDISPDLVRVGLVTFSSSSELRFPLNRYQDVQGLLKAVKAVPFKKGNTATHMAFLRTRAQVFQRGSGDRRNVTNVIVLLTGEQSRFPDRTLTGARQLKNDGAIIYAVGIGDKLDKQDLSAIASDKDTLFTVDSPSELLGLRNKLLAAICTSKETPGLSLAIPGQATVGPGTTTAYVPPLAVHIDDFCGKCVVNGGPLTENGAVGYIFDPYSCTSYWMCERRPNRGLDGWMYTVIVRNCSIGTVWDQDSQACIRCDDPKAICRGTAPKPPMGSSHCPFPDQQTGLRPTKSMYTWGESCTDSVGNTLTSVVEDEQIYYVLQYPRAPVGPVSCFPHRFSLSRCGCEAPVFSSIIFQYEEDYASIGKTAYSEPNDVAHASLCENTIEVPDMARVGDGALCIDEFGHVEIPYFKNNPPDYPFTIHFFYWLDEDVNTEGRSIALLNNGKCDILPTVEIYFEEGGVGVYMETEDGFYDIPPQYVEGGGQGAWVCVAVTYDGDYMALYLEGEESEAVEASGDIVATESAWILGNSYYYEDEYLYDDYDPSFEGRFDEVSFYNRVLSAEEIGELCSQ